MNIVICSHTPSTWLPCFGHFCFFKVKQYNPAAASFFRKNRDFPISIYLQLDSWMGGPRSKRYHVRTTGLLLEAKKGRCFPNSKSQVWKFLVACPNPGKLFWSTDRKPVKEGYFLHKHLRIGRRYFHFLPFDAFLMHSRIGHDRSMWFWICLRDKDSHEIISYQFQSFTTTPEPASEKAMNCIYIMYMCMNCVCKILWHWHSRNWVAMSITTELERSKA